MNTFEYKSIMSPNDVIKLADIYKTSLNPLNVREHLDTITMMLLTASGAIQFETEQFSCLDATDVTVNLKQTVIRTNSEFSLQNIVSEDVSLEKIVYDTRFNNILESADKPYAVKGLTAVILTTASSDAPKIRKNLDDYVRMNIYTFDHVTNESVLYHLYIGTVNSSKTDYYTPFGDLDSASAYALYDFNSAQYKKLAQTVGQQVVNNSKRAAGVGPLHNDVRNLSRLS